MEPIGIEFWFLLNERSFEMKIDLSKPYGPLEWQDIEKVLATDIDVDYVKKAFVFSKKCHQNQLRISGEDFVTHPLWMARIVAQLGLGQKTIVVALLHDTLENSQTSIEEIATLFGDEVALLVDGLTEVSRKTKGIEIQKNNLDIFRNFLFSSVNDVRVLIIRLIDKLHNGLTIEPMSAEVKIRFAKRVMSIYGPVAAYVGLYFFKQQLEDIAFTILYPAESKKLVDDLEARRVEEEMAQSSVIDNIQRVLVLNRINGFEIQSRIKSLYSTFLKLSSKDYQGDRGLKDRVGFRILLATVEDCYIVLGLIHSKFRYLPDEFHDYISNPKINGYRSLQTTVYWKDNLTVEIQIRTFEMHEYNEFGPASHIAYKMSKNLTQSQGMEWVKDLVKWQKNDTVNNYQISVLTDNIYVFTPKGDVIQLPCGSCGLDFAYTVHSHLGDFCKGILVNKKMVKISDKLKTGDSVEVLVDGKFKAKAEWLTYVVSTAAKDQLKKLRKNK